MNLVAADAGPGRGRCACSLTRLTRRLRRQAAAHSLTPTQLATLAAVDRHSAMTPGELAEHEKVQPPSMTRVIAALEERGLVDAHARTRPTGAR